MNIRLDEINDRSVLPARDTEDGESTWLGAEAFVTLPRIDSMETFDARCEPDPTWIAI